MAEKTGEVKAPDQAIVARAEAKVEAGDDLNQREVAALEAQRQIDLERGYREILWKGVPLYQAVQGGHTEQSEQNMIRYVNEQRVNAADPFNTAR